MGKSVGRKAKAKRNGPGPRASRATVAQDARAPAKRGVVAGRPARAPSRAAAGGPEAFPLVGVGASAGGLEAFSQLLGYLPSDTGMAFVLIQHLDPSHKSLLVQALSRATAMPVSEVRHRARAEPDHIYVTPSDADVSMRAGLLILVPRKGQTPALHLPIDQFFSSLAADRGARAIGVVLSGTASDGTEGLRAIKAEGGITLAQDPKTAKFGGMPQSAIAAGVADYALALPALAKELARLGRNPHLRVSGARPRKRASGVRDQPVAPRDEATLGKIMAVVKKAAGVDFREYKTPTFERRLGRRMVLRRMENQQKYLALIEGDPEEARALCEDALIHVSSFFRDPEVFEELKARVLPEILKHKAEGAPIRVWVAGCSTGEEVYSLAITLLEFLGDAARPHPIQLFGSDVSEQAVRRARAGAYADGAMRGISEDRRRRYFTKTEAGARINKSMRDLCVFVRHDLARDPPFSKLDLLSCRNVLIYFDPVLQKRILPAFHYGLNQPGFLLLGRTEHVSGYSQLFSPVARTSKIFLRSAMRSTLHFEPRIESPATPANLVALPATVPPLRERDVARHLDKLLLSRYAPPGVLINDRMEILQFRGQTGDYLESPPGEPQSNLGKMARPGLLSKIRATLARAQSERAPARLDAVEMEHAGLTTRFNIVVIPFAGLPQISDPLFVVLFEEGAAVVRSERPIASPGKKAQGTKEHRRLAMLEHELSATTEYLRSLVEEQSRSNEDLGSANEELVSGNEELQSLNEELETAKEELQSTNEELTTVNDELNIRNTEAAETNSDLANLLDTVDIPLVILDGQRHIRRFTPQARSVLNLLPTDVGRLFDDIKLNIDVPDMDQLISDVVATFVSREREVRDRDGQWYRMQIRSYRQDRGVAGAIVSLIDIDTFKHHLLKAQKAKEDAERADQAKDQFLAVLSHELRTPLSAMLMQLQLLRQAGADLEKSKRACDAIERSTKSQVNLVDDLLDVSRIVTGKMRVDLQRLDLAAAVRSALDSVAVLAGRRSIELVVSLDPSIGPVAGDRTRLEQVVVNLVGNAIKFTPEGGKVEVLLERVDGLAHLRVTDTGMGIEATFLPHIFNRLTQIDSSSTRPFSGLGLGLAIVRYLVDAHGGTVRAESPGAGRGATFHVTLPLLNEQPASTDAATATVFPEGPPAAAGRLQGRRILIVEDDTLIREALTEMLADTGAFVRTARSAAVGITLFRQFRPHAVLCDIAMPREDGHSLIRRIRALGPANGGDTPAVSLPALAGEGERRRALAGGFQMHLAKPIEMGRLVDTLVLLLEGQPLLPAALRPGHPPLTI